MAKTDVDETPKRKLMVRRLDAGQGKAGLFNSSPMFLDRLEAADSVNEQGQNEFFVPSDTSI
jgi:hypothetical protein